MKLFSNIRPVYFIIVILTLICFKVFEDRVVEPNASMRISIQSSILKGNAETQYKYSILQPAAGLVLQKLIYFVVHNSIKAHLYSYKILNLLVFLLIFILFYIFLKNFFTDKVCMVGLLLLGIVIPSTVNGYWIESQYYNLLFFITGLILIIRSKDYLLPLVFAAGMLNSGAILFLIIFYIAHLISENKIHLTRSYFLISLCLISSIVVYYAVRLKFGTGTGEEEISNLNIFLNPGLLIQLWAGILFVFIFLSIKSFKKSSVFFKLGLYSLLLYLLLCILSGNLYEPGAYLPAFLILIPMSLLTLTGESLQLTKSSGI